MIGSNVSFAVLACVSFALVCQFQSPVSGLNINGMDVQLKRFANCEEYPSLQLNFKNVDLSQVSKKKFVLNGEADLNATVTKKIVGAVTITKCEDSSGEDSCEFIATAKEEKFCDKISTEGTPWNKFMKKTEIGTKCPIDLGSYTIRNAPLEIADAEGIPLTPGYWKLRLELTDAGAANEKGKNPVGCNVAEFSVNYAKEGI